MAELSLIDVAAAQVTDGFTLSRHRGSVTVIQLVLLRLSNELAGQVEKKFLNVVRLFGWRLQVQHALSLGKVFSPLPEDLSLLCQIYFITYKNIQCPFVNNRGNKTKQKQTTSLACCSLTKQWWVFNEADENGEGYVHASMCGMHLRRLCVLKMTRIKINKSYQTMLMTKISMSYSSTKQSSYRLI